MATKHLMRKTMVFVLLILACFCFFTVQANATPLFLSSASSDETPAEWLTALLEFEVSENDSAYLLRLTVTNLTGVEDTTLLEEPAYFNISEIYFNATSNVQELIFLRPGGWELFAYDDPDAKRNATKADGFGIFDFALKADKQNANNPDLITPGEKVDFIFDIVVVGAAPSDTDFTTEFTTDKNGNDIALVAAKFVNGPDWNPTDDSAFGAIPEPATLLLVGTGLIGLAGIRRKRNSRKTDRNL